MLTLNADIGEGFPNDAALAPFIDYANIACGGHYGNMETIVSALQLMINHNVKVGAHPSYPDLENFGRASLLGVMPHDRISESLIEQLSSFKKAAEKFNITSYHVKPHGALYNDSYYNEDIAKIIVDSIIQTSPDSTIAVMCQPGSKLEKASKEAGLPVILEGFIDRRYKKDGTLTPRSQNGSVLEGVEELTRQIVGFAKYGAIVSDSGELIPVVVDTLCIHSDSPSALESAKIARVYILKKEPRIYSIPENMAILSGELGIE